MNLDERRLAAKIRSGDPQVFDTLYRQCGDRVLGFALRLTGGRAEAEDLVQEVFLAAYAGRSSFQGRARPLSWLLGIAVRRWRDLCRRHVPQTTPIGEEERIDSGDPLASGRSAVEEGVVNALTLSKALSQLDAPFREALLLVASQGMTYKEAAQVLGEPVGTVKWRVSQAIRWMHSILDAVEEEFDELQQSKPGAAADGLPCRG